MKRLSFLFILSVLYSSVNLGQEWVWSNQLSSDDAVTAVDMAVDNNDNVYLTGTYWNTDLTIQGISVANRGDRDGYLCKFDPDGTLLWLRGFGSTDRDFAISDVIVGNSIYVVGDFRGAAIYFTPTDSLENVNNFDAFLAEYDLNGNFIDATRIFYGTDIQRIKGMIYNSAENNLLIIGQFKNELKYFDGTSERTVNPRGAVGKDHFVVKSSMSGDIQDTVFFQTSSNNTILKDLNKATTEGFYITGDLYNNIEFSSPSNFLSGNSATTADAFVVKLNTNLDFQWARMGGGTGYDHVNSSVSDKYGNIYLTGKVEATVQFDSTATLQSSPLTTFGAQDLYLAKYNKTGVLQWIRRKGDEGDDDGFGLVQRENMVQFCGNIAGEVIFNVDTLRTTGTTDVNTGFAIFSQNGTEIGAQGIGGTGTDRGEAIAFNTAGNTIIGGIFDSPMMDIGDSTYTNSSGTDNGFIAEYYYPMNAVFTSITEIECHGDSTGRLIATPYFGVSPYSYAWSANVTFSNDSLAYNLPADTYSVTITDSRAVTASTYIDLTQPAEIAISKIMQEVSCYSENGTSNDGSIDLTVTGGTVSGAYTYEWEALSGSGVSPSAQDQFTLTTGEYSVTVTDDNLCQVFDTSIIAGPGPILFSGTLVTPATGGASDGAIDLTVTGGNDASPYSYLWDDGPTTEDRTAIPGGDYTVTVTDILSCQADTTLIVEDATLFIAFISDKTNVDCKGNSSGSATVSTSGGVEPYSYAWENSVGNPIPGDNTITDVPKGTYYVTVTDDIGSTASTSVQITEPAQVLSTSIVGSDLQCYGDNSGILDLTVTGGTLPYSFSWSNGVTTEDQVGIPASTYTVTVTDARNCTEINSKDVNQPPAMGINITIDAQIMCYGDLTGIVTATATGGTGTFSYQWDDPGAQNTQQATELEAGTYHVTATDLAGCEVSSQILLTQPAALTLSATPQDISCFGEEDGQINLLTPAGGTPPYYYDWSNGAISQDIEDLSAGTYSVTVTDAHNCIAYLESEISEPEEVTIAEIVTGNASCQGYTDGQIVVTGQGGNGSYQYSVDNGNSYSSSNTFTDLAAGNYSVVIMDGNDCESAISPVELTEPEGTTISSEEAMNISCNGLSDGSITLSASSPVGGLEYSIDEGETYLDNNGAFAGLEGGSYQVWIRDADDCITQSSVLEIIEPEAISIDTSITQPGEGVSGTIRVFATGGTTPYDYYLLAGENEVSNSDGNFSDLLSGDYSVWIIDVNLCESDTLQVILNPYTSSGLIIYNAFSPNADGVNDTWTIGNISMYPDCIVTIMNTWGNKVFTSDGYPEPWDGTYNDKELPAGTYYYIIDLGDGSDPLSGPVSIVR